MRITIKAMSRAELDERIKDSEKRGYVLEKKMERMPEAHWSTVRYMAVMKKEETK